MFLQFYGLREDPFRVCPDTRFLYPTRMHEEARASLLYALQAGRGFVALIARPGTGKTTLLLDLLDRLKSSVVSAYIFQTQCDCTQFLEQVLIEFGMDVKEQTLTGLHEHLKRFLIAQNRTTRRPLLVVDEAQNLPDSVLETLRLLSNFETQRGKLLHIVVAGQEQLAERFQSRQFVQLRQRISVVCRLQRLSMTETEGYVAYRLQVAGHSGAPIFTKKALSAICAISEGIPRNINNVCFHALSTGYALDLATIDSDVVEAVANDLDLTAQADPATETYDAQSARATTVLPFRRDAGHWTFETAGLSYLDAGPDQTRSVSDRRSRFEGQGSISCADALAREMWPPVPEAEPAAETEAVSESAHSPATEVTFAQAAAAAPARDLELTRNEQAPSVPVDRQPQVTDAPTPPLVPGRQPQQSVASVHVLDTPVNKAGSASAPERSRFTRRGPVLMLAAAALIGVIGFVALGKEHKWAISSSAESVRDETSSPAVMTTSTHSANAVIPAPSKSKTRAADAVAGASPRRINSPAPPTPAHPTAGETATPAAASIRVPGALHSGSDNEPVPATPQMISAIGAEAEGIASLLRKEAVVPQLAKAEGPALGTVMHGGELVSSVRPVYPPAAVALRREGSVLLKVEISADGNVTRVTPVHGDALLIPAAVDAVRRWRYRPEYVDGKRTPTQGAVTIKFKLKER